ncbi:MAG: peptidylprolyl isomerase [Bacteroidota bacterium]|nr:peptidylprolyl isomerase [Bacteroidota bacterium]
MRLKKLMMTTLFFALFAGIIGCSGSYVADIAGDKISVEDFEKVYAKNNGGREAAAKTSVEDRQKFLDLYVKFRLKVKEAYALGYNNDAELRNELNDYRKNLGVSYMLEKEINKPAMEQMYNRKLKQLRASHILIGVSSSNPADTIAAFNIGMTIIDSLKKGYSFEQLAVNNSKDPSVQNNKGDIYYFSAGQLVPEFEDVAYSMKVGEFSTVPVKTQFGYHIIKITDIKENHGPVQASHIMKRMARGASVEDSTKAAKELLSIRDSVLAGKDFAEYAKTMSDDTYSGGRGGDLGFIERGRTVREFDEALYNLKDGELSGIVQTQFGLHLIKRAKAQGIAPFKDMEQQLKSEYQNYRFQYDYNNMVGKIKKMYSFKENDSIAALFANSVDTSKTTNDAKWDSTISSSVRSSVLLTFTNAKITVDSVITLSKSNPELKNLDLKSSNTVSTIINKVGTGLVTEYHARQLEDKFPEFGLTMKEYEEGILLFKAEQENVWNKVQPSDSLLKKFHAEHHSNYTWPDRVNIQEIFVATDSIARIVKNAMGGYTIDSLVAKKSKSKSKNKKIEFDTIKIAVAPISFDSAAARFNTRNTSIEKRGVLGLQLVTTNDLTSRAWTSQTNDTSQYFPFEGGFSFIKILQKDAAREKTFEEAASEVSSAYQEFETKRLGDEWYESLKKKYPVVLNKEGLAKTYAKETTATSTQQP